MFTNYIKKTIQQTVVKKYYTIKEYCRKHFDLRVMMENSNNVEFCKVNDM